MILERLTIPDDEHITRLDMPVLVGLVCPAVEIINYLLLGELNKFFASHKFPPYPTVKAVTSRML